MEYRWTPSNCSWEPVVSDSDEQDTALLDVGEDDTDLNQLRMVTVFAVSVVGILIVGTLLLSMCYRNERVLAQLPCWKDEDEDDSPEVWVAGIKPRAKSRRGKFGLDPKAGALQMMVSANLLAAIEAPALATQSPSRDRPSMLDLSNLNSPEVLTPLGILHDTPIVTPTRIRRASADDDPYGILHTEDTREARRASSAGEGSIGSFDFSAGSPATSASPSPLPGLHSVYFAYDIDNI